MRPLSCSTLVNDWGGMAAASTCASLRSAEVRGMRVPMSRAATTIVLRLVGVAAAIEPGTREPRYRKRPRATRATTAPMIVKGRPLIAGILRLVRNGRSSCGDLRIALGGRGLLVEGDRQDTIALSREGVDDHLAGEGRTAVAGDRPVAGGPVDGAGSEVGMSAQRDVAVVRDRRVDRD